MVEMEVKEVEDTPEQTQLRKKEENNFSFSDEEIKMLKKIMEDTDPSSKEERIKDVLADFKLSEEPKHKEDMPISFLSIRDGEIERGKQWYLSQFNKLPDEIAELLARYNWGDLKYQTKKKVKNDKKKALRKGKKYEPLSNLEVKKGNFVVSFS